MTIADVAKDLVSLWNAGEFLKAGETYFADDVVSVEWSGRGGDPAMHGRDAVLGKGAWFANAHEIHAIEVTGPYINADQFTVRFTLDVTFKESGARFTLDEIALYTIKDDKIVEERFFYGG